MDGCEQRFLRDYDIAPGAGPLKAAGLRAVGESTCWLPIAGIDRYLLTEPAHVVLRTALCTARTRSYACLD